MHERPSPSCNAESRDRLGLFAIFALEVIVVFVWSIPKILDFNDWAFWDPGANLTVQYLIRHGYRPTVDFPYHYGLLPLSLGHLWSELFGLVPMSYLLLTLLCNIAIAWAIAGFAANLQLGLTSLLLLFATIPFAVPTSYPNLAHACEAALLSNGLAEQAAGRRAHALALATAAIFAKPSMGFVYGLIVIVFAVAGRPLPSRLKFWRTLLWPSAVTGIILLSLFAATYGATPAFATLLPITGARAYSLSGYGFFKAGIGFFYFPGVHVGYYIGSPVVFWAFGTICLTAALIVCLLSRYRSTASALARGEELLITCAMMHLAFLFAFFGSPASWTYYAYVLVLGLSAASTLFLLPLAATWTLIVLGLFANKGAVTNNYLKWTTWVSSTQTARLWMPPEEWSEWNHVGTLIGEKPAALLDATGAGEMLFPVFEKPVSLYFDPGLFGTADIHRKLAQLSKASFVVIPAIASMYHDYTPPEPLDRYLQTLHFVWQGDCFKVYAKPTVHVLNAFAPDYFRPAPEHSFHMR